MKKSVIFSITFFTALCLFKHVFASEINADSRISEVTVYPDSALITRIASLKLNPGEYKVIFAGIIPEIDENSLRVSSSRGAEVKLFGAQLKREFLEEAPVERVKQLKDEILVMDDEKKKLEDAKEILNKEKQFLESIRLFSGSQVSKDLVTKMPQPQELEAMLKFLDTKLKENYSSYMGCELKIRDILEKAEVLRKQLAEISGGIKKLKRSIIVDLEVLKAGDTDLNVSYLAMGASWQPIYDARADFEKSQVELLSYGIVKQTTGEEWADAAISLSTAKPSIGGRMPYISPWVLRPYQPPIIMEKRAMLGAGAPAAQFEAFDKDELKEEAAEREYAKAEERGIAVVYKLAQRANIKPDGSEHKLSISSQNLKADFEYSSYPRVGGHAYLGSRVSNAKDLQLLPGRLNIFLAGDFVGTSHIDNIGPGEEFDLYLGVDENVKVKREQIEKKVDETIIGGIPSPTKKTTFKYKLTVENYKSKKIRVKLFEPMPISQDDRIKVRLGQASLEPEEKDWKDRKGVWLWEMELEPGHKQEIAYSYAIEHPREMPIEGL